MSKKRKREAIQGEGSNINGAEKKLKIEHSSTVTTSTLVPGKQAFPPIIPTAADIDPEKSAKAARKRAKRERRKVEKESRKNSQSLVEAKPAQSPVVERETNTAKGSEKKKKKKEKNLFRKRDPQSKHYEVASQWQLSDALGGCLVDIDPVFSADEQYLLLAFESSIRVYSTSTSQLVRTLRTSIKGGVTAIVISAGNSLKLYVSLSEGLIEEWDWMEGRRINRWATKTSITGLTVALIEHVDAEHDLIYTIDKYGAQWTATIHHLHGPTAELHSILKSKEPITYMKVVDSGRTVVICAGKRLSIGSIEEWNVSVLKQIQYVWRHIECTEWITSLDVRVEDISKLDAAKKTSNKPSSKSKVSGSVDIVVGGLQGSIFVFRDFLAKLVKKERNQKETGNPIPQKLHWHRNGVGAAKWSADGNYIISGGSETVLLSWQLDTGRQDKLPHLSAPIESIVVSPLAASYAIRLADNSVMVMSTMERKPTAHIPGIQVPTYRRSVIHIPKTPMTVGKDTLRLISRRAPATVTPSGPSQMLLAVPAASSYRSGLVADTNAAYLQTFDARAGVQLSKQALTRTKVTDLNMGPESNILEEPNVVLLQTTHDGLWLASVDEWSPPSQDLQFLAAYVEEGLTERKSRMEIHLKFWFWNEESKMWELVSRINSPHSEEGSIDQLPGRILDIVEDQTSTGFVTIGDDGKVKIWRPRGRSRHGIQVRGSDGKGLKSWSCTNSTSLITSEAKAGNIDRLTSARVTYSEDESLLMVGYTTLSSSTISIIDPRTGDVHLSYPEFFTGFLTGLAVIGRHLILLSDELIVWDLVDNQLQYGFALTQYLGTNNRIAATHMAVDTKNQTYAIAVPVIYSQKGGISATQAQVMIFSASSPVPVFRTTIPRTLKALLPDKGNTGYLTIDSAAEVRSISLKARSISEKFKQPKPESIASAGLENIFGNGLKLSSRQDSNTDKSLLKIKPQTTPVATTVDDSFVVRQNQLTEIFDRSHPLALPPVSELFAEAARLFSRKVSTA